MIQIIFAAINTTLRQFFLVMIAIRRARVDFMCLVAELLAISSSWILLNLKTQIFFLLLFLKLDIRAQVKLTAGPRIFALVLVFIQLGNGNYGAEDFCCYPSESIMPWFLVTANASSVICFTWSTLF